MTARLASTTPTTRRIASRGRGNQAVVQGLAANDRHQESRCEDQGLIDGVEDRPEEPVVGEADAAAPELTHRKNASHRAPPGRRRQVRGSVPRTRRIAPLRRHEWLVVCCEHLVARVRDAMRTRLPSVSMPSTRAMPSMRTARKDFSSTRSLSVVSAVGAPAPCSNGIRLRNAPLRCVRRRVPPTSATDTQRRPASVAPRSLRRGAE